MLNNKSFTTTLFRELCFETKSILNANKKQISSQLLFPPDSIHTLKPKLKPCFFIEKHINPRISCSFAPLQSKTFFYLNFWK